MRPLLFLGAASWLLVAPAYALDVDFNGELTGVCSLALNTDGTLALSTDGLMLGSEETLGVPAVVAILSIGTNTVNVAAPARTSGDPVGYSAGSEAVEVSYFGTGGLSLITQAYTSGPTSFVINSIPLSLLTLHNRIVNPSGFVAGTYTTRTVVTCS